MGGERDRERRRQELRRRDLRRRSMLGGDAGPAPRALESELLTPPDPEVAAFFDLDNTLMQGASMFHLARGMYRRSFFTARDVVGFAWMQARLRLRGEHPAHVERSRSSALSFIAGLHVEDLEFVIEEIFDEAMHHRIWPGTRALAQLHLDRGEQVWLVTAAPVELAELIARRMGLTGALGTVAESVDGVYTGRLVGGLLHGAEKAAAVQALADRRGLDLARCAAYSDSANDLPMLTLVGHPCAVNPDKRLFLHARRHGWQVRDYRTGRKAARAGIVLTGLGGAVSGAVAAAAALRTKRR